MVVETGSFGFACRFRLVFILKLGEIYKKLIKRCFLILNGRLLKL